MTKLNYKHILNIIDDYEIFLFDLWGVVIEGKYNYPKVIDNINYLLSKKKKTFFITNAPRSKEFLLKNMQKWGLNVTKEMIITSGEIAIDIIINSKEKLNINNPIVYHLKTDENDLVYGTNLVLTENINECNILLLSLYKDENENLNLNQYDEIFEQVSQQKIITICANPDLGIMQQGIYRYCAGFFAKKIQDYNGQVIYAGKPYPEIYNRILKYFPDVEKNKILMIGDTLYTDILGANNIGINSGLVLTGNASKFHKMYNNLEDKLIHLEKAAKKENVMPNFIIELGEINKPFLNSSLL